MQDGQYGQKRKENHETKVTKIPKIKRQKYGMNKTLVSILGVESLLPFCALLFQGFKKGTYLMQGLL